MIGCYIGRGSLLVSRLDTGGGFYTLSGESEVTLAFDEDNESVGDARNGVNERVDWYVRNRRTRIEAECYRINLETLELLLRGRHTALPAGMTSTTLPPVTVGLGYALPPRLTEGSEVVADSNAVFSVVPPTKYEINYLHGLITFSDIAGYLQPFHVSAFAAARDIITLHHETQIMVQARFHGFNKVTGKDVVAEFYNLALDMTDQFALVQRGFSPLGVRMQAVPDVSKPLDPQLGQYGRIIL